MRKWNYRTGFLIIWGNGFLHLRKDVDARAFQPQRWDRRGHLQQENALRRNLSQGRMPFLNLYSTYLMWLFSSVQKVRLLSVSVTVHSTTILLLETCWHIFSWFGRAEELFDDQPILSSGRSCAKTPCTKTSWFTNYWLILRIFNQRILSSGRSCAKTRGSYFQHLGDFSFLIFSLSLLFLTLLSYNYILSNDHMIGWWAEQDGSTWSDACHHTKRSGHQKKKVINTEEAICTAECVLCCPEL